MTRPLLSRFGDRAPDSPLCAGAAHRLALAGLLLMPMWAAVIWAIA
jgi:hypothetical protein